MVKLHTFSCVLWENSGKNMRDFTSSSGNTLTEPRQKHDIFKKLKQRLKGKRRKLYQFRALKIARIMQIV